ncbi:MAG: ABC transporter permease [Candidatus Izemoplasmataceae bacterium]
MKEVFKLSLLRISKQRFTVLLITFFPLAVLFIPQAEGLNFPIIGYGIFGLVLLFSAFLLSKQLIEDRQFKTIKRIAASPISHQGYLIGHLSAYFLVIITQISLFSILGFIRWGGSIDYYLQSYLALIFLGIVAISFSLFWHTFFKTYATSVAIFSIAANLMALLGGLTYPLMFMPESIKRYSIILPTYWYAYAIEQITLNETLNIFFALLIMLGFAIIFVTIGSIRRFD